MIGDSACDIEAGHRAGTHTTVVSSHCLAEVTPDARHLTAADALFQVLRLLQTARR